MTEPLWCPDCGAVLAEHTAALEEKEQHLRDLELALRTERAKNSAMRRDRDAQRQLAPLRGDAEQVFEYWRRQIAPRAREFSGERFDAVVARLEAGHDVAALKKAIDGAKARPMEGRTTDLLTICRNETNLTMFMDFAEQAPVHRSDPKKEALYRRMVLALSNPMVERLCELRRWKPEIVREAGLGYDPAEKRIVFPARDANGVLVGFSRWLPNPAKRGRAPKNIAEGPRQLFPAPEEHVAKTIWLVEGEPDAIAMATIGYPAVAVPGVGTWKELWTKRFERFDRVRIVFDCDEKGREAAHARAASLAEVTDVSVIDLDPTRDDHWDVNDLLIAEGIEGAAALLAKRGNGRSDVVRLTPRPQQLPEVKDPRRPLERVLSALEALDCRPRRGVDAKSFSARCPNHDDRVASLSVTEGDDARVLLHCHTGCEPTEVVHALGMEMKELFAA